MKIAVVCPVGPLDALGYQRNARACIESMATVGDSVFLVSSTRNDHAAREIAARLPRIEVVSDARTWFARRPDGSEWFDPYRVMENVNVGCAVARRGEYDVAACMMANWYVPSQSAGFLRQMCADATGGRGPGWAWLYRADYLAGQMFHANTRIPFIVDLKRCPRFTTDAVVTERGEVVPWQKGDYHDQDGCSVVDTQLELTVGELRDRLTYMRFYKDIVPKRPEAFEWEFWRKFYTAKYGKKPPAPDWTLGPVGQKIQTSHTFVSGHVLEAMREAA